MNTHHTGFSRRQFVRTAALGAGSLAAGLGLAGAAWGADGAPAEACVGSNIFGWGQYYQRMNKNLQEHFDEVLSALRDAGYDYLEANLDAGNPDANLRLAERMKSKGLKPVTLYTGARLHEPTAARETIKKLIPAAQACRTAGFQALSCNVDPIGREKTEAELKNQVSALIELGQALREIGIKFGIHHHLPEMAAQAREFHFNFQQTDPKTIGFCYDVHWVWKGGVQPLDALKAYGERIVSWHIRQSREGIWWEDLDAGRSITRRSPRLPKSAGWRAFSPWNWRWRAKPKSPGPSWKTTGAAGSSSARFLAPDPWMIRPAATIGVFEDLRYAEAC